MGYDSNSKSESVLSEVENAVEDADVAVETKKDEKQHKCTHPGCNLAFNRPSRLQRHIRFHTKEKCFKCDYPTCDKAYTNNSHLVRHTKTHNAEKKLYKCSACSLYISNPANLKRHYSVMHMDRGILTCKECNETFTKKYQFKTHMAMHDSHLHKCDHCNKVFASLKKFRRHKTTHQGGNKQYPCTIQGCNEVFEKWILFSAHIKTQHVNEHKCKDCDKVFLSKQHLKMHSQVHTENRATLSCPFEKCPRVYYFKNNLTQHIRIYHYEEKYECDICKIKIGTKLRLRSHIEKLHMSETRVKQVKKLQRRKRKDAGMRKKSAVTELVGVDLPAKVEKMVLRRDKNIKYIEQFNTVSNDPN